MNEGNASSSALQALQVFLTDAQAEYEQAQKELREIDVLIRQSTVEVEKLQERNTQLAGRVRTMEMNLHSTPRDDIKELYAAAHEAQMRLFMMRSQVDQLQHRQQNLEQHSGRLWHVLELAEQIRPEDLDLSLASGGLVRGPTVTRVIEAQENERQRLARQMHDGPAQALTNLILQAEICERLFDTDPARARAELGNLKNAVNATFQRMRGFIFNLRPMMLDDLGLSPTLRQYVQDLEEKTTLSINLTATGKETRLPSAIEVTIFRIVQELLTNVQEHAHASHVQVILDIGDELVQLSVEDDGSGFDVNDTLAVARQRKGLGISMVQERVEMLNGQVQFESRIGRGTKVKLQIPLQ
jgi:two-component system sensor histidine kinase DegS